MRAIACVLTACLCLAGAGCSLFKKSTAGGSASSGGAAPAKFPGGGDPLQPPIPPAAAPVKQAAAIRGDSMLAGRVVDASYRPVSNAHVRWINIDDPQAAPIDVPTDADGYFTIMGVRQGGKYKLMARSKQGDKTLAGVVLASAPDARLVIPVRENAANAEAPPASGSSEPAGKAASGSSEGAFNTSGARTPTKLAGPPNLPTTMVAPLSAPSSSIPAQTPSTAKTPTLAPSVADNPSRGRLPLLTIPGLTAPKAAPFPSETPVRPSPAPKESKLDTGPTRVPSCVLIANHLENMALKDSKGKTWEYKKQGAGKLVLIDFWDTQCPPCRHTMPALEQLHKRYGPRGLVVIGIALEPGKDERRDADAVNRVCASLQVTYRQLLGRAGSFDVGKQFRIEGVPTLFLLNEQGDIFWYTVGHDPRVLEGLERQIQTRLASRPN